MFWKKKTVYETRPVYSIRQELERLRPFVCPGRARVLEHTPKRTYRPQRNGWGISCPSLSGNCIW